MIRKGTELAISTLGITVFLIAMPLFVNNGGGRLLLAEAMHGQVAYTESATEINTHDTAETSIVWGVDDVEFQEKNTVKTSGQDLGITADVLAKMTDFSYLRSNFYITDSRTVLLESDIQAETALQMDFTIDTNTTDPKVLIFHTHSHEGFADSDMSLGLQEGIWGVGEELKRILEEDYGIAVIHDTGQYDVVNGVGQITGAYERMEPEIRKILAKYPSIEVIIDMHRDGVDDSVRLVTEVDGKQTAQIMLFNGLCRLSSNGEVKAISGLTNEYLKENLAFSLQMQVVAGQNFPGLTRKIYLNPYRFSLHMLPRSTLVEVGAQTNTKQEAKNAMVPLAKMLAQVLLDDTP